MKFNFALCTDVGRRRERNQDRGAAFPDLGLFVVADGMGGHQGGETASQMTTELLPQLIQKEVTSSHFNPKLSLRHAIEVANETIYAKAQNSPELHGMGTTTTALLFSNGVLTVGQVGDSRCYFARPGALWQLTRDHSLVQEKLRAGMITRAQVKTDRSKNVITRSVGFEPSVDVELFEMMVQPGDAFLICSDGLTGMADDKRILDILQKNLFQKHDVQKTVEQLVAAANEGGGDDNITSLVVEVL